MRLHSCLIFMLFAENKPLAADWELEYVTRG